MYGDIAGDPGEPGCGDQAGLNPAGLIPLASLPLGENPGPPGVMPDPMPAGDHTLPPYAGVAPSAQGVMPGVIACPGEWAAPKNIPPPIIPAPMFMGISIPNLHFSASRRRSKQAVPILGSCPMMIFSETPLMGSTSAWAAASINTSTVSSKEHLMRAPVSCLLIPCLVMAIKWPLAVITSHNIDKWR